MPGTPNGEKIGIPIVTQIVTRQEIVNDGCCYDAPDALRFLPLDRIISDLLCGYDAIDVALQIGLQNTHQGLAQALLKGYV